jgi:hypothetical protein
VLLLSVGVAWWACDDGGKEPADAPELPYDVLCPAPGGACADASGPLHVGVAVRDITPPITETFCDCGLDGICEEAGPDGRCETAGWVAPDSGENDGDFSGHPAFPNGPEPFYDANANGYFDAVWMAGFGNAHPAQGVHDPLEARVLVLRKGSTTLALVGVDLVGYFYDEVLKIRRELAAATGVDLVMIGASHTHEGADSIGIWGFNEGTTGVNPEWMATIRASIMSGIEEAVSELEPATLDFAETEIGSAHPQAVVREGSGIANFIKDGRDPVVIEGNVRLLRFARGDGSTIASLVNLSNHPEALCGANSYLSADFVYYLRNALEDGIDRGGVVEPGLGGTAVFMNGAVGGMMSPLNVLPTIDIDGTEYGVKCVHTESVDDPFFARARAFGETAALDALTALRTSGETATDPDLSFATKVFRLPIQNVGYHAMFLTGVFYGGCTFPVGGVTRPRRCIYDFNEAGQLSPDNLPHVETEVGLVNIGPAQAVTVPGELLPEWFIGGYDGSRSGPVQGVVDEWFNVVPDDARACAQASECEGAPLAQGRVCGSDDCECTDARCLHEDYSPPDLTRAPAGPYLADRMTRRVKMVFGLTSDMLGYIIPPFQFVLDERLPYVEQAPGHYEETNSIGPNIGPMVEERLIGLLGVAP